MTRLRRLLVANRGEIAIRIARGARELGIAPVGIYSDADAGAMFREAMDATLRIGPGPAARSYLDVERVVAAAKTLGADSVHPGYGFLSERADFAQACVDAGLTFVGPTPATIAAMGSKIEAKRRAREAGVAVVPGYDGADQSDARLRAEAAAIGVPLLVKASAGGGGRGMRVVEDLARFDELLASARREALAAFGDDAVLLERYVTEPRHVEFQVLGDLHGALVHLGERECSIQRRHQKLVEEAPSVALDEALRERMGAAAIAAARSVGYTSAGTVEFVLAPDGTFAFLEVNARLQVEHPVTELVTGIDLVHEQLRIAAGERLRFAQGDVRARGWAIEVRLNAEDPARDSLPQTGTLGRVELPSGPGVRVDGGVRSGDVVSPYYDSLLAKVIAWAPDRAAAIARLDLALAGTRVDGLATNLPLLRAILRDDAYRAGDTTTAFLVRRATELAIAAPRADAAAVRAIAHAVLASGRSWRAGGVGMPVAFDVADARVRLRAARTADGWTLEGDGESATLVDPPAADVALDDAGGALATPAGPLRFMWPAPPSAEAESGASGVTGEVVAPMPGTIARVAVAEGATVAARELLVVLDAMKMEHRIEAPIAGVVMSVRVAEGALVRAGEVLAVVRGGGDVPT